MEAIQTYTYKIRSYHTDTHGRLFVHQLLNFLQDAAHNHADGFGFGQTQLAEANLVWVLSRLTIEIDSLPKHGDSIELSSWVKSRRGSISEREFSLKREGTSLINASSLWFCLSTENYKPARIPVVYSKLMQVQEAYATSSGTLKIEETTVEREADGYFTAQYSDIDMVDHVNNATYTRWAMDALPSTYQAGGKIKRLIINYIGQCFLGDAVGVTQTESKEGELLHEIRKVDTQTTICRLQTQWEK